jgi:hypothetical protein
MKKQTEYQPHVYVIVSKEKKNLHFHLLELLHLNSDFKT